MINTFKPVLTGFVCLAFLSCKKEVAENTAADSSNKTAAVTSYYPYNSNAAFSYMDSTSGGSAKAVISAVKISGDTSIDGQNYSRIVSGDNKLSRFCLSSDGETKMVYFDGDDRITTTILKVNEPVGAVWKDQFTSNNTPMTYEWKMMAKDLTKTIQGTTYSNVIQVHLSGYAETEIQGKLVFADADYYYAPNVGLIENIAYNPKTGAKEFHRVLQPGTASVTD